jgi:putative transport protein
MGWHLPLSLDHIHNVTVTRIRRAGVEVTARGTSRFHYGDVANIVGDTPSLDRVTKLLGNSVKSLNETRFAPIFLGIVVGIFLGMMPLHVPGLPHPVKLGLAGGPLVAAIALSLIGNVG